MFVIYCGMKVAPFFAEGKDLPIWEVYGLLAGLVAFFGIAAYQGFQDRPGVIVWLASIGAAFFSLSLFFYVSIMPLVWLILRSALGLSAKFRSTKPTAGMPEDSGHQTKARPATGGSGILETLIVIAAIFWHGEIFRLLPNELRPMEPSNGRQWFLLAGAISFLLTVFVHELGHAIGGNLAGFRLVRFAVYPFDYFRGSKVSVFRLNFKLPASGLYAGVPKLSGNLHWRFAFLTACGPLLGIVFSIICWAALWIAQGNLDGILFGILNCAMTYGLFINLINLLPLRIAANRSDGRILWDAIIDRQESEANAAVLACSTSLSSDLRPKDWSEEWVFQLRARTDEFLPLVLLAASAEDRLTQSPADPVALRDLDLASQGLSRFESDLTAEPQANASAHFHNCWLRSRYYREPVSPDFKEAQADPLTEPFEILRLQAAIASLNGDPESAVELLTQAEQSLTSTVRHGIDLSDLEGLKTFRAELLSQVQIRIERSQAEA
jgi:hypothetical protein